MKNDTASYTPQQSFDATLLLNRVGLITECNTCVQRVRKICTPVYDVALISPNIATEDLYTRLKQLHIIALLVQWGRSTLACAAQLTKFQVDIPIIALCKLNAAEQVSALMMGADFIAIQPPTPAIVQALRVAYYQRGKAHGLPPSHNDGYDDDNLAPDTLERIVSSVSSPSGLAWPAESVKQERHHVLQCGPFLMDLGAQRLLIEGKPVALKPQSFSLCAYLLQRPDCCCTRDELLREVWGLDFDPSTNVVDVQIYAIRKALDAFDLATAIQTVRGVGYKFVWPPPPEIL